MRQQAHGTGFRERRKLNRPFLTTQLFHVSDSWTHARVSFSLVQLAGLYTTCWILYEAMGTEQFGAAYSSRGQRWYITSLPLHQNR